MSTIRLALQKKTRPPRGLIKNTKDHPKVSNQLGKRARRPLHGCDGQFLASHQAFLHLFLLLNAGKKKTSKTPELAWLRMAHCPLTHSVEYIYIFLAQRLPVINQNLFHLCEQRHCEAPLISRQWNNKVCGCTRAHAHTHASTKLKSLPSAQRIAVMTESSTM